MPVKTSLILSLVPISRVGTVDCPNLWNIWASTISQPCMYITAAYFLLVKTSWKSACLPASAMFPKILQPGVLCSSSFASCGIMQNININSIWRKLHISYHWPSNEAVLYWKLQNPKPVQVGRCYQKNDSGKFRTYLLCKTLENYKVQAEYEKYKMNQCFTKSCSIQTTSRWVARCPQKNDSGKFRSNTTKP